MTADEGKRAPAFTLPDQNDASVRLSALKGRRVLVYFYPRADTPGCTTQACGLRDIDDQIGDTAIIGVSPDTPAKLKKFDDKYGLGFTLVSDVDHAVAEKYGVWVEKKELRQDVHGRTTFGVPGRCRRQDRAGMADDQAEGHTHRVARRPRIGVRSNRR